jgi:hypothetical protein
MPQQARKGGPKSVAADGRRVAYVEGQRLSAADLQSEQWYLLALDERHKLQEHAPGMVRGLKCGSDLVGRKIVTPGIAIDSLGRVLIHDVSTVVADASRTSCVDLWIVYCCVPVRVRQRGRWDCSAEAFQRWREFGHVIVSRGDQHGDPIPPVDDAVYVGRIECDRSPDIAYTALIGQAVDDPGGRTSVHVGPSNSRDRNGFTVAVADATGAEVTRLAIDRMGNNTFWGDVTLSDYRASLVLRVNARVAVLVVAKTAGTAGEHVRVRVVRSRPADGREAFGLAFLQPSATPPVESLEFPTQSRDLTKAFQIFTRSSHLVGLKLIRIPRSARFMRVVHAGEYPLHPSGGSLKLAAWPPANEGTQPPPRGCDDDPIRGSTARKANGISFTASAQPLKGTPLPGVSTAKLATNGSAFEQMRLDLGAKKDNDPTRRFSVGADDTGGKFVAWLAADGVGAITLIGGDTSDPNKPPMSFDVTGTIEQQPLKADATDPEFTNLVVLAWLHGLQNSVQATTAVQLALSDLPPLIETGLPWSYTVTATNVGSVPVLADKLFETRTIAGQTLLASFPYQTTIQPQVADKVEVKHQAGDMLVGDLSIEVRISGKIGTIPWWKSTSTKSPIPVVQSPNVDLSKLPPSVQSGADFDYSFFITNASTRKVQLTAVWLTEGASPPQQLLNAVQDLDAGSSYDSGPRDHDGGITADLDVTVSAEFTWHGGPASVASAQATIKVT